MLPSPPTYQAKVSSSLSPRAKKGGSALTVCLAVICVIALVNTLMQPGSVYLLGLSFLAGMSTVVGGVVILLGHPSRGLLACVMGIAAGVMIVVSIFDMWLPAIEVCGLGESCALLVCGGLVFVILDNFCMPTDVSTTADMDPEERRQYRVGLLTMITLTCHNLPEGLAVVASSLDSEQHGILMATAIALHNVLEGVVIAAPIYAATRNWHYALLMTAASGLSEPLGALLALGLFREWLTHHVIMSSLCFIGGVMLSVSSFELLPEAFSYGRHAHAVLGLLVGAVVMWITIVMLG